MLQIVDNNITSPVRQVKAKVEFYNGSTLADTFFYTDALQEVGIDRVGEESKFFGFGICQKASIKLRDVERAINPTTDNLLKIYFAAGESYINNYPLFYVTETHRDENTNALSITAYDMLKKAEGHTVAELGLTSYTLRQFAETCGSFFGLTLDIQGLDDTACFDLDYPQGANFEGTETIRQALNAVAEATQTIYFVTADRLIFKRLANLAPAALTITREDYITLKSGENRRLQSICSTNELGDSTTASISAIGTTQFIRDNPFLELREDIAEILDKAIAAVGGLTINQFSCSWRGNFMLVAGDKIDLETKDGNIVSSFVINDSITYNGSLSEVTQWNYTDSNETAANPTTLGEALKQTYAKVDKANKQIDIVASETTANKNAIASLQLNTGSITASVSALETKVNDNKTATEEEITAIKSKVETQITPEEMTIAIQQEIENGVDKVTTSTGFTFNEEGLTISKSGSEITTKITEDGMNVNKGSKEVLTANNEGVKAIDLHATTFLIIGKNSRFEDYPNKKRTACFWIGGNN